MDMKKNTRRLVVLALLLTVPPVGSCSDDGGEVVDFVMVKRSVDGFRYWQVYHDQLGSMTTPNAGPLQLSLTMDLKTFQASAQLYVIETLASEVEGEPQDAWNESVETPFAGLRALFDAAGSPMDASQVNGVTLEYRATTSYSLVMNNGEVAWTGQSHAAALPAADTYIYHTLRLEDFLQPEWLGPNQLVPLDLTQVMDLSFEPNLPNGGTSTIQVRRLLVHGHNATRLSN
jgi:hypothetical protein